MSQRAVALDGMSAETYDVSQHRSTRRIFHTRAWFLRAAISPHFRASREGFEKHDFPEACRTCFLLDGK